MYRTSSRGDVEVVRILVESGVGETTQNEFGVNHIACGIGPGTRNLGVGQTLLDHGADMDHIMAALEKDKPTPLHTASKWKSSELACVLLEHGADPTAQDRYGHTHAIYYSGAGFARKHL